MSLTKKQLKQQLKQTEQMLDETMDVLAHTVKMAEFYKYTQEMRGEGVGVWYCKEMGEDPENLIGLYEEFRWGEDECRKQDGICTFQQQWKEYFGYEYPQYETWKEHIKYNKGCQKPIVLDEEEEVE